MASDYDKLKEMYRLQGQEEQGRRFREMIGSPEEGDMKLRKSKTAVPSPEMKRELEETTKRTGAEKAKK